MRALGFPTHLATATSHFVLSIIAGTGAATHVAAGSFAHGHGIRRAIALSIGVVAGAQLGARLSLRASGRTVETLLGVALLVLAARLGLAARLIASFRRGAATVELRGPKGLYGFAVVGVPDVASACEPFNGG